MASFSGLVYNKVNASLILSGKLDKSAVMEVIRRYEPQNFTYDASENIAWKILEQELLKALSIDDQEFSIAAPLKIDVTDVEKVDSIGLAALLHLLNIAASLRRPVSLVGIGPEFQKLINLYHLQPILEPYLQTAQYALQSDPASYRK